MLFQGLSRFFSMTLAAALFVPSPPSAVEAIPTSFRGLDGASHTLVELRGHPAVVNFWATWCIPCKEEMPRLEKLSAIYQAQGVRFVAVSIDGPDTQGKIPEVLAKRGFTLPIWTGATDRTLAELQLGDLVPATLILDDRGDVVGKIEGEARDKDIRTRLDWLLQGRQGKQPRIVQKNDW